MRRFLRFLTLVTMALALVAAGAALWARGELRASLPQLDGERRLPGLGAPATIERDARGIPTIRAATREDVARATGFVHAQDRFFQMDLSRRRPAGELAELVGARAVAADHEVRLHRFRAVARAAVARLREADRRLLEAYTAGVNSGLAALVEPPFEYTLLRQTPARWRLEDTLLVVLAMFVTLQDSDGAYEQTIGTMREVLPPAMFDFMAPRGSEWDAPLSGTAFALAAIPGPEVYDLRSRRRGKPALQLPPPNSQLPTRLSSAGDDPDSVNGSNNFAVAGSLSADGGALLANDMHLGIRVPNTWYRAVLEWPGHRLMGITLPGAPALVVGSNGYVAWGFTNTYADWSDIVLLETDPARPNEYRTPHGWRAFELYDEVIKVAGGEDEHVAVRWTQWGPVLAPDFRGRQRAFAWVAHSAEMLAGSMTPLEGARTVEQAFDEANGLGTPGQNLVVADAAGRIGWSVYGAIPRRAGLDGRGPTSWADGQRRWDGWLADAEYPRVVDPAGGRIWTANARVADGDALAKLGDGSYEIGSRARIIRDRLAARQRFTARDLLAIQLDASAAFLARWRDVLLKTLTADAVRDDPRRAEFRHVVEATWTGEASPRSASYRLTREFRELVSRRVMAFVLAECYEADATFDYRTERRRDAPIYRLVTEGPPHLLDPQYESWPALLLDAVDAIIEENGDAPLAERVWAQWNVTAYRHPLSGAIPLTWRWLDMPYRELPGDLYTPRQQFNSNAASQRMVVSPGREAEGIMHMPTGQSGHPLSPFYSNSHEAWVNGEPTPFLPGATQHTLTLTP